MAKEKASEQVYKKIDTATASKLYGKDQRTIRRWCERGTLKSKLDPGGNWEISISVEDYNKLMEAKYQK